MDWMRRCAGLGLALLAAGCGGPEAAREPPLDPPRGTAVPFTRMNTLVFQMAEPGTMLIRDGEAWRALWKRYAPPPGEAPAIDFTREMVAAVSFGGYSSCIRQADFVHRVEQTADSLRIVLYHPYEPTACDLYVEPLDLVRLPRSELPARFVPAQAGGTVPGPARWLAPGSTEAGATPP